MKKLKYIFIYIFICLSADYYPLLANEKENIIDRLNITNSLKFDFSQNTNNNIVEKGHCFLLFPKKLKCIYNNGNKELLLNDNKLAIIQKRYNKIYFYPVSKSFFNKVFDKRKLKKLVQVSVLKVVNDEIQLMTTDGDNQKITILFNKNNYNLLGWKVEDQFKNNIVFLINIEKINEKYETELFDIPKINQKLKNLLNIERINEKYETELFDIPKIN